MPLLEEGGSEASITRRRQCFWFSTILSRTSSHCVLGTVFSPEIPVTPSPLAGELHVGRSPILLNHLCNSLAVFLCHVPTRPTCNLKTHPDSDALTSAASNPGSPHPHHASSPGLHVRPCSHAEPVYRQDLEGFSLSGYLWSSSFSCPFTAVTRVLPSPPSSSACPYFTDLLSQPHPTIGQALTFCPSENHLRRPM